MTEERGLIRVRISRLCRGTMGAMRVEGHIRTTPLLSARLHVSSGASFHRSDDPTILDSEIAGNPSRPLWSLDAVFFRQCRYWGGDWGLRGLSGSVWKPSNCTHPVPLRAAVFSAGHEGQIGAYQAPVCQPNGTPIIVT